jgi:hypothetical protein
MNRNMKMKITKYLLLLALLALASCSVESPEPAAEQPVEITLAAETGTRGIGNGPATRAGTIEGSPEDHYVNSLRVLGFRTADGTLAFNNLIFYNKSGKVDGFTGKIQVITGRFTLVLIANEHADSSGDSMYKKLQALQLGVTTLNDLGNLWFQSRETFDNSKNIPMIARVNDVKITPTGAAGYPVPGTTNLGDPLRIVLRRLAVRISLRLRMTPEQVDAWWSSSRGVFNVEGISDRVYLFPRENSNPSNRITWIYPVSSKPTAVDSEGFVNIDYPRIILPEVLFSPVTNKTRSMSVSLFGGGKTRRGTIAIDNGTSATGYTIPRNNFLQVTATSKPDSLEVTTAALVEDWGDEDLPHDM